jgi:hypothetical protein
MVEVNEPEDPMDAETTEDAVNDLEDNVDKSEGQMDLKMMEDSRRVEDVGKKVPQNIFQDMEDEVDKLEGQLDPEMPEDIIMMHSENTLRKHGCRTVHALTLTDHVPGCLKRIFRG